VTPSPTDSTIPAPSCPRTMGKAPSGSFPESVYASELGQSHVLQSFNALGFAFAHKHAAAGGRAQILYEERTGMADTGVVYLDADLVCLWWCDLDVFNGEVLAGFPGDCGLCVCQCRFFSASLSAVSSSSLRASSTFRELHILVDMCKCRYLHVLRIRTPSLGRVVARSEGGGRRRDKC
jgi:hypothetical protein